MKIGSPPANPNADQPLTRAVTTIGSRGKGNINLMHVLMDICGKQFCHLKVPSDIGDYLALEDHQNSFHNNPASQYEECINIC